MRGCRRQRLHELRSAVFNRAALAKRGSFNDGVYTWLDERGVKHNADGYQAVWRRSTDARSAIPSRATTVRSFSIRRTSDGWRWQALRGSRSGIWDGSTNAACRSRSCGSFRVPAAGSRPVFRDPVVRRGGRGHGARRGNTQAFRREHRARGGRGCRGALSHDIDADTSALLRPGAGGLGPPRRASPTPAACGGARHFIARHGKQRFLPRRIGVHLNIVGQ